MIKYEAKFHQISDSGPYEAIKRWIGNLNKCLGISFCC